MACDVDGYISCQDNQRPVARTRASTPTHLTFDSIDYYKNARKLACYSSTFYSPCLLTPFAPPASSPGCTLARFMPRAFVFPSFFRQDFWLWRFLDSPMGGTSFPSPSRPSLPPLLALLPLAVAPGAGCGWWSVPATCVAEELEAVLVVVLMPLVTCSAVVTAVWRIVDGIAIVAVKARGHSGLSSAASSKGVLVLCICQHYSTAVCSQFYPTVSYT